MPRLFLSRLRMSVVCYPLSLLAERGNSQRHANIFKSQRGGGEKKVYKIWLEEASTVSRSQADEHQSKRHTSADHDHKTGSGEEKREKASTLSF